MAEIKRKFEAQTQVDLQRLQPKVRGIARSGEEAGPAANVSLQEPRSAPPRDVVLRLIAWFKRD